MDDCSKFCSRSEVSVSSRDKIEEKLDHLRRLCTRLLASVAASRSSKPADSDDISDELLTPPLSHHDQHDYGVAVIKLLSSILTHFTTSPRSEYAPSCVQSYIILAQASLSGQASLPSRDSYSLLEKASAFLQGTVDSNSPLPIPTHSECLRSLSLAHWAFATSLYRQDQMAAAVPFLTRSCELGDKALKTSGGLEDQPPWYSSLSEQMPKRWELLGSCEGRTGDRKVSELRPSQQGSNTQFDFYLRRQRKQHSLEAS